MPPAVLTPVAVFGTDDRVPLPPRYQKVQEAIGLLFNVRARSVCTAFCVGESIIATAAHCLYRPGGKAPQLADFWFARNYDAVRDYARIAGHASGAAAQNVVAGSTRLSVTPPIDATSDWALIRLARPVCAKGTLAVVPLASETIMREAAAGRIFQIAYHRDFTQWRPAYSKPCPVTRTFDGIAWDSIAADFSGPDNLLLHTCDTGGASSGSPLLIDTPDGAGVVGINVGTYVQSKVVMQNGEVTQRLTSDTVANTAVAGAAFAERLAALRTARILMSAGAIREVQNRLRQRGHYAGAADGTYGPALKTAIEAFEAARRLPRSGLASEALLARLRAGDGETAR